MENKMSGIIRPIKEREMGHIVKTDDGMYHYVDSAFTPDHGYETMSFLWDEEKQEVFSWGEEYAAWYGSPEEMENGHSYACTHLEECLESYS